MTLTTRTEWNALDRHRDEIEAMHLQDLFADDTKRGTRLSATHNGLYLDYSKQRVTTTTMNLLTALADAVGLRSGIDAMYAGAHVNTSEQRAVLHTALRCPHDASIYSDGVDVVALAHRTLEQMRAFAATVRDGSWRGFTGKPIRNIVNVGIGGSDLGPMMAYRALADVADPQLQMRFVSNIDGNDIRRALNDLDPRETLVLVSSKTFTTTETLTNAHTARRWLLDTGAGEDAVCQHFVAISANPAEAARFGIDRANVFEFWDWVGGRYSLTSAIGLSLMLAIGADNFDDLLAGAHDMDSHFRSAPWRQNLPVLLGLLGIWNRNFLGSPTHAVLPYDARLADFPSYLQQLEMESNGKSVDRHGDPVLTATAPVVWGAAGTNGQHSFYQLLHQGTSAVPADFIGVLNPAHNLDDHHDLLTANLIAQTRALAFGRDTPDTATYRSFPGNRPSTTLLIPQLTPYTLGQLVALYEHKVFTQGWIWGINSFDQWGVELGKVLAAQIHDTLRSGDTTHEYDSSTTTLINRYRTAADQR